MLSDLKNIVLEFLGNEVDPDLYANTFGHFTFWTNSTVEWEDHRITERHEVRPLFGFYGGFETEEEEDAALRTFIEYNALSDTYSDAWWYPFIDDLYNNITDVDRVREIGWQIHNYGETMGLFEEHSGLRTMQVIFYMCQRTKVGCQGIVWMIFRDSLSIAWDGVGDWGS